VDAVTAAKKPAARRKRAPAKPEPVTCPDCDGHGEITEAVKVGARKSRITGHRQTGLCLTCLGTGQAAD
jgi:hypothetical protein